MRASGSFSAKSFAVVFGCLVSAFEVKVPELPSGYESRGPEDEVHALKLRLNLAD